MSGAEDGGGNGEVICEEQVGAGYGQGEAASVCPLTTGPAQGRCFLADQTCCCFFVASLTAPAAARDRGAH